MAGITTDHPFLRKHQDQIHAVLSCFDRVIVRGYLPICHPRGLMGWLHQRGLKYWKLKEFGPQIAERLLNHAKDLAKSHGREYRYLPTRQSKEELARQIAERDGIAEGLVCVFSCLETCATFRLKYGKDKSRLEKDLRRCTVLYYFFMDAECGLIHVKLHTWLPLTCQVYINGHSWLERQLGRRRLEFRTVDNAFVHLGDPGAAQRLADRFIKQNWRRRLDQWARLVNPLMGKELGDHEYYWVVDQAEYSTDVIFREAAALKDLYPALVEHATLCLGSEDVLRFLGRKPNACFKGDVQTERKRLTIANQRVEGVRVKHVMKTNRLKMYNKEGLVLRIETVINDPTEFRVRRWHTKRGRRRLAWRPMRKSVSWLWRYLQVASSANRRYLESLAVVDDPRPAREMLDGVCKPAKLGGRRRRALQPLSPADQALFRGALCGEHHLHGLRNADLTRHLYGEDRPKDPGERRRRSARVTRLLQLLRAHGLIAKVPRARRYRVTPKGLTLMSAAIYVRHKHLPKVLLEAA